MDRRRTAGVAFYLTNTVEFVPDEPYPTPEVAEEIHLYWSAPSLAATWGDATSIVRTLANQFTVMELMRCRFTFGLSRSCCWSVRPIFFIYDISRGADSDARVVFKLGFQELFNKQC
ncbi:uncharacterized protein [Lolium perenne]|uniref:uncharacterized protein n=1 Tax=Lolium perenne TaxID=4522 RepID=UPI003A9A4A76